MNDGLAIIHKGSIKIAQAVWGDKKFSRPLDKFKLKAEEDTIESRNEKVYKTLKAKGLI